MASNLSYRLQEELGGFWLYYVLGGDPRRPICVTCHESIEASHGRGPCVACGGRTHTGNGCRDLGGRCRDCANNGEL